MLNGEYGLNERKIKAEDLSFQENDEGNIKKIKQYIEKYKEYNIKRIQKLTGERDIEIAGDIPNNTAIIMEAKRVENGKIMYAKLKINGNIKEEAVILSNSAVEVFNEKEGSCVIEKGAIVMVRNDSSVTIEGRVKEFAVIETQGIFKATAVNDGAIICVPERNISIIHDKRQKPEASGYDHEYVESITDKNIHEYGGKKINHVKDLHFGQTIDCSGNDLKMPSFDQEYHIYSSDIKEKLKNTPRQDYYYIGEGESKRKVSKEEFTKITGMSPEQISEFSKHAPKPKYYFHDDKQSQSSNVEGDSAQSHKKYDKGK
ncbi:hypothetical protein [Candidatus Mesenet endosymbiont of Agriotes lineatus]|uniref:hypothetical protein n=1 Tax=Candidatus Mesenet endosymbiont of Agriotes lineatus TaxID=3077948 RepID=UPI0030CB1CAF